MPFIALWMGDELKYGYLILFVFLRLSFRPIISIASLDS